MGPVAEVIGIIEFGAISIVESIYNLNEFSIVSFVFKLLGFR